MNFRIITLGCKLNQLESEALSDAFLRAGFQRAADGEEHGEEGSFPSVVIVNTCTVTSKADQKARRVIRKALRDYSDSLVFVTGCYARLSGDELLQLDNGEKRRLFVINKERIIDLPQCLKNAPENAIHQIVFDYLRSFNFPASAESAPSLEHRENDQFQFNPKQFSTRTRSLLKIQDGCDKKCSYCGIRLARGPSVSLDSSEALSRLRILEESHAEAVLTGVNICQYREPPAFNLTELINYLLNGTEKINIRLSSLEPDYIDEKLTKVLERKRVRPHFHLSVQSGSKKILESMGRGYSAETVEKAASFLRGAKDDPFLACDIITGFPGETETEFEETFTMCQKIGFAWIHVFPYSRRPGTEAFAFPNQIRETEVTRRVRLLTELAKKGKADYTRRWLGRVVDVLVEKSAKSSARGVSDNYLKVLVQYKGEKPEPGVALRCKLSAVAGTEYDAAAAEI